MMDEDGAIEGAGDDGLLVAAEVVAEFGGIAVLVEHGDSVFIADAGERGLDVFELRSVALQCFELARFVLEDTLHDGADETLAERNDFLELDVGGFRLEHPELREMTARLRFFSAEGRAEGVDPAESHRDGFGVELAALRQVGFLVVDVIHFEEGGRAFAGGGGEHGRVGKRVALAIHEFARGADGLGANAEDGSLAGRSNPQMALIEQEIDAMLFELDGEGRAFRNFLDDLDLGDADFVTAWSAFFSADFAGDDDA